MNEAEFKRGAERFAAKEFSEAIQIYSAIASKEESDDDDKVRALNNISGCLAAQGQYQKAFDAASSAIDIKPNAKTFSRAATALEGLLRYQEAARHMEKAVAMEPSNQAYSTTLSRLQNLVQKKRGLVSEEDKDAFYYQKSLTRAKEAMQSTDYTEAIHQFKKALSLQPSSATGREVAVLLSNLSAACFRAEDYDESLQHALKAVERDSSYPRALFRVACAKEKMKSYEDALDYATRCVALDHQYQEAITLRDTLEPIVKELRKTPAERLNDEAERIRELREKQLDTSTTTSTVGRGPAKAHSFVYCTFCNELGHRRGECPLLRKRPRTD